MASNFPPTPPAGGPPGPPPGGYPPPPPQGYPGGYQPPAPPPPPKKKMSPWLWGLFGCLALVLLVVIGIVAAGGWAAYQIKKNPAAAMAKVVIAANPHLELVSENAEGGVIKFRDKETGKTFTMDLEDVKNGRMVLEDENGERVSIDGSRERGSIRVQTKEGEATFNAGGAAKLPGWFPAYPGAAPQSDVAVSDAEMDAAGFHFSTSDPPSKVFDFYVSGLKSAGLTVHTSRQGEGGVITAEDEGQRRQAWVTVMASDQGTSVKGTVNSKR